MNNMSKELIKDLDYFSYEVTADNHSLDNSILTMSNIEEYCRDNNMLIMGHQEAPFRNGRYHVAMVVYDVDEDELFWVHTSLWNFCELLTSFGVYTEELKNKYIEKFGEEF